MAGFDAPTLTTTLTNANWRNELNTNFQNIDQAFNDIETILDAIDLTRLASFSGLLVRRLALTVNIAGTISAGTQPFGLIASFQGLVDKAYARCRVAPAGSVIIDIQKTSGVSVLSSGLILDDDATSTTVVSSDPGTDYTIDQGDYLNIVITEGSGGITGMEDLQIVLVVLPQDFDIYQ